MPNQADKVMTHEGRPKKFDFLEGNARRIEGTMEHPVMYHALGTEPRTQHPYHVYEDIRSEPTAVKATLDVIQPAVDKNWMISKCPTGILIIILSKNRSRIHWN